MVMLLDCAHTKKCRVVEPHLIQKSVGITTPNTPFPAKITSLSNSGSAALGLPPFPSILLLFVCSRVSRTNFGTPHLHLCHIHTFCLPDISGYRNDKMSAYTAHIPFLRSYVRIRGFCPSNCQTQQKKIFNDNNIHFHWVANKSCKIFTTDLIFNALILIFICSTNLTESSSDTMVKLGL